MTMEPDAEYSHKLKQARAEIEALLIRYDIAGHVVLHEPGFGEVFTHLSPSYSELSGVFPTIRFRSKAKDYGDDLESQRRDLEATANMTSIMAELIGRAALMFIDLDAVVSGKTGAEHSNGKFTPG